MEHGVRTRRGAVIGILALMTGPPAAEPAFPGRSGKIAFTSDRDGGGLDIYVMNADGTGITRLTTHPAMDEHPVWSADGAKIAFHSLRDGDSEVYVMNADGSGQTRITTHPGWDYQPAWSPDRTRLAFASNRDGNWEIYVMNADGSGQTRLTSNTATDLWPAWSPDGTRIAFESQRDGNGEVYVIHADGSGETRLTSHPAEDREPAWSPDGRRIAFRRSAHIFVMNADGSSQTQLTVENFDHFEPAWAPDGTRIAFSSTRHNGTEVLVMNPDGSGVTRLTTTPASDYNYYPSWQPLPFLISPAGGLLAATESVDLTLILTKPGVSVTGGSVTVDGVDRSGWFASCAVPGTLVYGRTWRCAGLQGSFLGVGPHTVKVTLQLSDGTSVTDTAYYTVLANTEP